MKDTTKAIYYGGFANVSNQSFNIYEYEVEEDMHTGEIIFSVPVPISELSTTYNLTSKNLDKEIVLDTNTEYYPFNNFVIHSKDKDFVESVLKEYRQKVIDYFKEKYESIENTSVSYRGAVNF